MRLCGTPRERTAEFEQHELGATGFQIGVVSSAGNNTRSTAKVLLVPLPVSLLLRITHRLRQNDLLGRLQVQDFGQRWLIDAGTHRCGQSFGGTVEIDVLGDESHGGRAHSADAYIAIEGSEKVAGMVRAEQSYVDVLYACANWPT